MMSNRRDSDMVTAVFELGGTLFLLPIDDEEA